MLIGFFNQLEENFIVYQWKENSIQQ